MTITELLQALKERLKERKGDFVITDDWNGDTEGGFYTTREFDLNKLYDQMDKFGEELRVRGTPEHLATQPQAPQGGLTAEQIDKVYRDVWTTVPHASRLTTFAHRIYALKGAAPTKTPEVQK